MMGVVALITILISQEEVCNNQDLAVIRFLEHGRKNQERENVKISILEDKLITNRIRRYGYILIIS
jgi:hypothetical protein